MTASSSIYEQALGDDWHRLAPVLRRHYGLAAGESLTATGSMSRVYHAPIIHPALMVGGWIGLLFPEQGENVPTTLVNTCGEDAAGRPCVDWKRTLRFTRADGRERVRQFNSRMTIWRRGDEALVVETVALRQAVAIRLTVDDNGMLVYNSTGFYTNFGGVMLPVPAPARIYTAEWAHPTDPDMFCMTFTMTLPVFGVVLGYEGEFRLAAG